MHKFFVDNVNELNKEITLTGNDVNHIKNVLRLSVGDEIVISNGDSREYISRISEISDTYVLADIVDICDSAAELPVDIVLFQGMPKGDKIELVIQKAVELGACEIVPVMMERTIVKLDDKKKEKKLSRYRMISESAAKQSGRGIIPEIKNFMSFKEAANYAASFDKVFVPYENAEGIDYSRKLIADFANEVREDQSDRNKVSGERKKLGIFIGPEGGFSPEEIDMVKEMGAEIITLGNRILRTETAGLAILSILMFYLDS